MGPEANGNAPEFGPGRAIETIVPTPPSFQPPGVAKFVLRQEITQLQQANTQYNFRSSAKSIKKFHTWKSAGFR